MENSKISGTFKMEENDPLESDTVFNENIRYENIFRKKIDTNFSETKVCSFFLRHNYCKYGETCKFVHSYQPSEKAYTRSVQNLDRSFFKNAKVKSFTSQNDNHYRHVSYPAHANKQQTCRYFKAGNCKNENCLYRHVSDNSKSEQDIKQSSYKKKRVPICHYFKKNNCQRGDNCRFYHHVKQEPQMTIETSTCIENEQRNNIDQSTQIQSDTVPNTHILSGKTSILSGSTNIRHNNKNYYQSSALSEDEIFNLRNTEIIQLKKRFPRHTVEEDTEDIFFTFEPSDPDWPFDLRSLDMKICFPEKYPVEVCRIAVQRSSINIPEILVRYLNRSIDDWLDKRHKEVKLSEQVELVFRPFLKWFDKNLEELFICGLKKVKRDLDAKRDGIEFVPVEKLFSSSVKDDASEIEQPKSKNEIEPVANSLQTSEVTEIGDNSAMGLLKKSNILENSALKQGIKVMFVGLELVEGAATLSCTKLALMTRCIRCKTSCNMKCLPGKSNTSKCTKCSKVMECTFNPLILHQFSNVAGNLHLIECQVIDINLVESCFLIDCLNCSKQVQIDGLHYGQKQKRWCTFCNEKLVFGIESVKFQAISFTYTSVKNEYVKKVEKKKDSLIKEGAPLPDFGTCKHYKKSHRWLRFPCCGRIYPCDLCHDEKENDHEMKFASRMICGFCSKEQPYSKEKPCLSCSGSLTAKSGTHWEGGKGCRNKIKMSRDDKHKYVGTCKTVSKKAQSLKTTKK